MIHYSQPQATQSSSLLFATKCLMPGHLSADMLQKVGRSPCIAGRHYCTWLNGASASTSLSSSSAPGSSEALALRLPAEKIALALPTSAHYVSSRLSQVCLEAAHRQVVQFTLQQTAAAYIQGVDEVQATHHLSAAYYP